MNADQTRIAEFRAENLAEVLLTRRADLAVNHVGTPQDDSLDFVVHLARDGQPSGRMFGVMVKAAMNPERSGTAFALTAAEAAFCSEAPFPVCQFAFQLNDGSSHWRWLVRPVVPVENRVSLQPLPAGHLRTLDDAALEHILGEINHWYDARLAAA